MRRLSKTDIRRAEAEYDAKHQKQKPEREDAEQQADRGARAQLASWRRKGHGVWRGVFIAEGYDGEFEHIVPGRFSKGFATQLMRIQVADQIGCSVKYVHPKSLTKEA